MTSIVNELASWTANNSQMLHEMGIKLTAKIPDGTSNIPWKASIALEYGEFIVSYTVWERTKFQVELLVMNAVNGVTVVMDDREPLKSDIVFTDLDDVVTKLLSNAYKTEE